MLWPYFGCMSQRKSGKGDVLTFRMGAMKTDTPVRMKTMTPVTLCSLKQNHGVSSMAPAFPLLLFPLSEHSKPA